MKYENSDEFFMREALLEARQSAQNGEIPVGAVVVSDGQVLARAHNETVSACDPTAHAEMLALRKTCLAKENHRIPECSLYVTLEPCAMCIGAIIQARIKRLVYGAPDLKSGSVKSIIEFPFEKTNHQIEIDGGVLAGECGEILKTFFKERR